MNRLQEFILTMRDSTVGHWHFRDNLLDETANDHDLSGTVADSDFAEGYTENGITVLDLAAGPVSLAAASATLLNMGTDDCSIELILRTTFSGYADIISKWISDKYNTGWKLTLSYGDPIFSVGDGSSDTDCVCTTSINDGKWHYLAITVDRSLDQIRIYIDGAEDASSPFDISAHSGNSFSVDQDLVIGAADLTGQMDEICISKELLTSMAVVARAAGNFVEIPPYEEGFLLEYLPRMHHGNPSLTEFLVPFNYLLKQNILSAEEIIHLVDWSRCPERFLKAMASNVGFELIDQPYASESERRMFLRKVGEIYQKKGTVPGIELIIDLLGYDTPTITESFSITIPFITNLNRVWDIDLYIFDRFSDDFTSGNLSLWNAALNTTAWWRIESGIFKGLGNGTDDDTNGILFNDTKTAYRFEVEFEILSRSTESGTPYWIGLYLRYQDADNWLRLTLTDVSGSDKLVLTKKVATVETSTELATVTEFDPADGAHVLWIWDDGDDNYTAGIDSTTFAHAVNMDASAITRTKKGLWINYDVEAGFTPVQVTQYEEYGAPLLFDPAFAQRELQIELNGTPDNDEAKRVYLERIVPHYVPAGIDITWV